MVTPVKLMPEEPTEEMTVQFLKERGIKALIDLLLERAPQAVNDADGGLMITAAQALNLVYQAWHNMRAVAPDQPDHTQDILFTGCIFRGHPPIPYPDWYKWAESGVFQGVEISAIESVATQVVKSDAPKSPGQTGEPAPAAELFKQLRQLREITAHPDSSITECRDANEEIDAILESAAAQETNTDLRAEQTATASAVGQIPSIQESPLPALPCQYCGVYVGNREGWHERCRITALERELRAATT